MDTKQKQIAAVAVVLVIIVAAVAVYFVTKDKGGNDSGSSDATVTFLIQDDTGVYFWVKGDGTTVYDAWEDAMKDFSIPYEASTSSTGEKNGITSMFGLATTQTSSGGYVWWAQYTYTNGSWTTSSSYMNGLQAKDNAYFAIVYGDGTNAPATTPSNAVVYDFSYAGTVFTIQSTSGMYFKINGTGTTVFDAWENAMTTYKIPYEASTSSSGEKNGITSMFGLATTQTSSGDWVWWSQYTYTDGAWTMSSSYMNAINSADNPVFGIVYGDGSVLPKA